MRRWHKVLVGTVAGLLLAIVLTIVAYRHIQQDLWADEAVAGQRAIDATPLETVERIVPSYGKEAMMIVYGRTSDDKPGYAWVTEAEVRFAGADEGVDEAYIRERLAARSPEAEIERVVPSVYRGSLAWEVLYQADGGRSHYDYYRFMDGELLETITLKS